MVTVLMWEAGCSETSWPWKNRKKASERGENVARDHRMVLDLPQNDFLKLPGCPSPTLPTLGELDPRGHSSSLPIPGKEGITPLALLPVITIMC